jgi:hypothetical protein
LCVHENLVDEEAIAHAAAEPEKKNPPVCIVLKTSPKEIII